MQAKILQRVTINVWTMRVSVDITEELLQEMGEVYSEPIQPGDS